MSDKDKDKGGFEKIASKDRARYEKEMLSYVPPPVSSSSDSSEEEDEESDDDSDESNGSDDSDRSDDDDSDDSESDESDDEDSGRKRKRKRGSKKETMVDESGGPPYPRVEYCAKVIHEPKISTSMALYMPTLSTMHRLESPQSPSSRKKKKNRSPLRNARRSRTKKSGTGEHVEGEQGGGDGNDRNDSDERHERQEQQEIEKMPHAWQLVMDSALAVAATMSNGLSASTISKAPLPGFLKHLLCTQGRRSLPCYVATRVSQQREIKSIKDKVWDSPLLQHGHNAMSPKEVSCMVDVLTMPKSVGSCDLLSVPNYNEWMNVPLQLLSLAAVHLKKKKMKRGSVGGRPRGGGGERGGEREGERGGSHGDLVPVSVKCIYLRRSSHGSAFARSSGLEYCLLTPKTPWLRFSSEVVAVVWEIDHVERRKTTAEITTTTAEITTSLKKTTVQSRTAGGRFGRSRRVAGGGITPPTNDDDDDDDDENSLSL